MGAFLFITMRENPSVQAFKIWIFPSLVSLLGLVIWSDVKEVKADVKALMAQSNIDKTKIENLERQIFKTSADAPLVPFKEDQPRANTYAVLPDTKLILKWQSKSL